MKKKVLFIITIITVLFASMITMNADFTVYKPVYELYNNIDRTKTFDSEQVISGTSTSGTTINVSMYWFKSDYEESAAANKQSIMDIIDSSGNWILSNTSSYSVGASGIFAIPVTLNEGKNKIILNFADAFDNKRSETIMVELVNKEEVRRIINNYILKDVQF